MARTRVVGLLPSAGPTITRLARWVKFNLYPVEVVVFTQRNPLPIPWPGGLETLTATRVPPYCFSIGCTGKWFRDPMRWTLQR